MAATVELGPKTFQRETLKPSSQANFTRADFSPREIAKRSERFRKVYADFITLDVDHPEKLKEQWDNNIKQRQKEGQILDYARQVILNEIRDDLTAIRTADKRLSKKDLASEEWLPYLLEQFSEALYLTSGMIIRRNQLEAIVAVVIGNKKEKVTNIFTAIHDAYAKYPHDMKEDSEGKGNIAEVPTGNGKTIAAAITAMIFALEGRDKAVFVAGTNDYVSSRDVAAMGSFYNALGFSVSFIASRNPDSNETQQYLFDPSANDYDNLPLRAFPQREDPSLTRQSAYQADIVCGAESELKFDWQLDQLVTDSQLKRQIKGLNVLIPDEIDQIAIADAANPSIIEVPQTTINPITESLTEYEDDVTIEGHVFKPQKLHELFYNLANFVDEEDIDINRTAKTIDFVDDNMGNSMTDEEIYAVIEGKLHETEFLPEGASLKSTTLLTPLQKMCLHDALCYRGIKKATLLMQALGILSYETPDYHISPDEDIIFYYLRPALRARSEFLEEEKEFGRERNHIILLEQSTGRPLEGLELGEGGQQALEAVLGLPISIEQHTLSDRTTPEFFAAFPRIAGFTASARQFAEEFHNLYHLDVISIPEHTPSQRIILKNDILYPTWQKKFEAIFTEQIMPLYITNGVKRPILVGLHTAKEVHAFHTFLIKKLQNYNSTAKPEKKIAPNKIQVVTFDNRHDAHVAFGNIGKEGFITITDMAGRAVDPVLGGQRPKREHFTTEDSFQQAYENWQNEVEQAADVQRILDNLSSGGQEPEKAMFTHGTIFDEIGFKVAHDIWQEAHDRIDKAGGLHAVGERADIVSDMQFGGRVARGDKGSVIFYSSLEDYLFVEGFGQGILDFRGIQFTNKPSHVKRLIRDAQRYLYLSGADERQYLQEIRFPLQKRQHEFDRKRDSILTLGEGKDLSAIDELVLLGDSVKAMIEQLITNMTSVYQTSLDVALPEEIPSITQHMVEQFYRIFHLSPGEKKELRNDIFNLIDPDSDSFFQRPLKDHVKALLTEIANKRFSNLLQQLRKQVATTLAPQFVEIEKARGTKFTSAELATYRLRATIQWLRRIILETMDKRWQKFREEQLAINKHIRFAERQDPFSKMEKSTEENYCKVSEILLPLVLNQIYSRLGNYLDRPNNETP